MRGSAVKNVDKKVENSTDVRFTRNISSKIKKIMSPVRLV